MQSIQREATDRTPVAPEHELKVGRRKTDLVGSRTSDRYFSLAGMRAITGILAVAALVLLSLVVFPRWTGPPIGDLARRAPSDTNRNPRDSVARDSIGTNDSAAGQSGSPAVADAFAGSSGRKDSGEPKGVPNGLASKTDSDDPAVPDLKGEWDGVAPRWPSGVLIVEGAQGDRKPGEVTSAPEPDPAIAESRPSGPPTAGAEFLMVVYLPKMESPTEAWIESLFRQAEPAADDPSIDGFQSRLSDLRARENLPPLDSPDPSAIANSARARNRYVVQANADLLRLIIDRMPGATIECSALQPIGGSNDSPEALPVPRQMFRVLEPFKAGSELETPSGELPRADRILRSLGVDKNLQREYCILFEFHFGH